MSEGFQFDNMFTAEEVKDFKPLPEDTYCLRITGCKPKIEYDESGRVIKSGFSLTYTVVGGDYDGRLIFEPFTFQGYSDKAKEYSRSNLSRLMNAVGVKTLNNTNELIGYEFEALVKIKKGDNGYDDSNKIARRYPKTTQESTDAVSSDENSAFGW